MTNEKAAKLLEQHNLWRRGDENVPMANPFDLGAAIDLAVLALRFVSESNEE